MKKFEIRVDAYGQHISKCFHKLIETSDAETANVIAGRWCNSLMGNDEVGEFNIILISIKNISI